VVRIVRCQGAIIQDDRMLLVQHCEYASGARYWVIPGGGQEGDESEAACVAREMLEETHLEVAVERLLFEVATPVGSVYQRQVTYLCRILAGEAAPGSEPEPELINNYGIAAVQWFDLRDPAAWDPTVHEQSYTVANLRRVQAALGYSDKPLA
jgi:ADP-ribose pyrophosphatase YjhB (NUDIX family)